MKLAEKRQKDAKRNEEKIKRLEKLLDQRDNRIDRLKSDLGLCGSKYDNLRGENAKLRRRVEYLEKKEKEEKERERLRKEKRDMRNRYVKR